MAEYKISELYNLIGSLICHQLPERTLTASGIMLPMCARDTGIYLGVFTGVAFIAIFGRLKADRQPSVPLAIVLCLFMIPMMFDGIGSYLGFYSTDNTIRLFTGAFFGLSMVLFLFPAANFKIDGSNENKALKNIFELGAAAIVLTALCLAVLGHLLPYILTGTVIVVSLLFLLGRIAYTIIALASRGRRRLIYVKTAGALATVIAVLYVLSAFVLQPLKAILLMAF